MEGPLRSGFAKHLHELTGAKGVLVIMIMPDDTIMTSIEIDGATYVQICDGVEMLRDILRSEGIYHVVPRQKNSSN